MSVATSTAIIAASAIGAGASLAGGIIGSRAAKSAAQTQADAADQIKQQALDAAKTATGTVNDATAAANADLTGASGKLDAAKAEQLAALKPYIDAGQISLKQVQDLLSPTGELGKPVAQFQFTSKDYQDDPQYAFIRDEANKALERSAAARGGLSTGGTLKAAARLNTNLTNTFLDSAFGRAKATYDTNRTAAMQRLQLQLGGLENLTGIGYSATGVQNQDIGNAASQINANDVTVAQNKIFAGKYAGDTGLTASQIAANALAGKANATAAGDIGSANAFNAGLGGIANAAQRAAVIYSVPRLGSPTGGTKPPGSVSTGNYDSSVVG